MLMGTDAVTSIEHQMSILMKIACYVVILRARLRRLTRGSIELSPVNQYNTAGFR